VTQNAIFDEACGGLGANLRNEANSSHFGQEGRALGKNETNFRGFGELFVPVAATATNETGVTAVLRRL
jgi:hypothetical protein